MKIYPRTCFTFTINNYTPDVVAKLHRLGAKMAKKKMHFICYGKEKGKKCDTPHLQGYAEWRSEMTVEKFNSSIGCVQGGVWAHCEYAQGHARDCAGYCLKGENECKPEDGWRVFYDKPADSWRGRRFGECSERPQHQGARTDLTEVTDQLLDGETTCDEICVMRPKFYHQYGRTLQKVEDIAQRQRFRDWMTKGVWIYGKTGAGKSRHVFKNFDPQESYVWKKEKEWQDGYTGQPHVIINELRALQLDFSALLEMVDGCPYFVERRGREAAPFLARVVTVTSSLAPWQMYVQNLHTLDSFDQFTRRFKVYELVNGELLLRTYGETTEAISA